MAARARGIDIEYGDAASEETLRDAGLLEALALVVTVPDPATVSAIVATAKSLRPDLPVIARARYAAYTQQIAQSGVDLLVNEEKIVGERLASAALRSVGLAAEGMGRVASPQ
jgi:CPA2 family monovalent cation:H+ antiporter-2